MTSMSSDICASDGDGWGAWDEDSSDVFAQPDAPIENSFVLDETVSSAEKHASKVETAKKRPLVSSRKGLSKLQPSKLVSSKNKSKLTKLVSKVESGTSGMVSSKPDRDGEKPCVDEEARHVEAERIAA